MRFPSILRYKTRGLKVERLISSARNGNCQDDSPSPPDPEAFAFISSEGHLVHGSSSKVRFNNKGKILHQSP